MKSYITDFKQLLLFAEDDSFLEIDVRDSLRFSVEAIPSIRYSFYSTLQNVIEMILEKTDSTYVQRIHVPDNEFLNKAGIFENLTNSIKKNDSDDQCIGRKPIKKREYVENLQRNVYLHCIATDECLDEYIRENNIRSQEERQLFKNMWSFFPLRKAVAQASRLQYFYKAAVAFDYLYKSWADGWILDYGGFARIIANCILRHHKIDEISNFTDFFLLYTSTEYKEIEYSTVLEDTLEYEEMLDEFRIWLIENVKDTSSWLRGLHLLLPGYMAIMTIFRILLDNFPSQHAEIMRNMRSASEFAADIGTTLGNLGNPFASVNSIDHIFIVDKENSDYLSQILNKLDYITYGRVHIPLFANKEIKSLISKGIIGNDKFKRLALKSCWKISGGFMATLELRNNIYKEKGISGWVHL